MGAVAQWSRHAVPDSAHFIPVFGVGVRYIGISRRISFINRITGISIGISDLILWLKEPVSHVVPVWIFNFAIILHSDEAILSAGFISTIHFFNVQFMPTKFPMETVV